MSWLEYQNNTMDMGPHTITKYLLENYSFKRIIDLGCGSGNDTLYLLDNGKEVIGIDAFLNEEEILKRASHKESLELINDTFENVTLPKSDCILSLYALSFCKKDYFTDLMNKIYESLYDKGLLVANIFGERDDRHLDDDIITLNKEEILTILKLYDILKWDEYEYDRDRDQSHIHYYEFIARKK